MTTPPSRTDAELALLDVPLLIRYGLGPGGAHRRALFGDGAVAAAIHADGLGTQPRSLAFLAQVVRRGGVRAAADLPEPLPGEEPSQMAGEWLDSAASVVKGIDGEEQLARWLEAVAAVLELRIRDRAGDRDRSGNGA